MKTLIVLLFICWSALLFGKQATMPTGQGLTDPRMAQYIEDWNVENFTIHMNNHVSNTVRLYDEIFDNYLANGIPANPTTGSSAISAVELRRSLGIPEDVWSNPALRGQLREHIRGFMQLHDASKVNTTTEFIQEQDQILKQADRIYDQAGNIQNRLIIEQLGDNFGVNFYPNGVRNEALFQRQGRIIDVLNNIDDHVGNTYLSQTDHLDDALKQDWVETLARKLEKMSDLTDRWGNPVSPYEFQKQMFRGSSKQLVNGRWVDWTSAGRSSDEITQHALLVHLEDNYRNIATHYDDAHQTYRQFFNTLSDMGIDENMLDPVKKYNLLAIVQDGRGSTTLPSRSVIRQRLLVEHLDQTQDALRIYDRAEGILMLRRARTAGLSAKRLRGPLHKHTISDRMQGAQRPRVRSVRGPRFQCFELGLARALTALGN